MSDTAVGKVVLLRNQAKVSFELARQRTHNDAEFTLLTGEVAAYDKVLKEIEPQADAGEEALARTSSLEVAVHLDKVWQNLWLPLLFLPYCWGILVGSISGAYYSQSVGRMSATCWIGAITMVCATTAIATKEYQLCAACAAGLIAPFAVWRELCSFIRDAIWKEDVAAMRKHLEDVKAVIAVYAQYKAALERKAAAGNEVVLVPELQELKDLVVRLERKLRWVSVQKFLRAKPAARSRERGVELLSIRRE